VEGITRNKNTGDLLAASAVKVSGQPDDQLLMEGETDADAVFSFTANPNSQYRIRAEKNNFHPDSLTLSVPQIERDTTIKVVLNLQPVFKVGDRFVLEDIYYDFDKHFIRPDAALILDELV